MAQPKKSRAASGTAGFLVCTSQEDDATAQTSDFYLRHWRPAPIVVGDAASSTAKFAKSGLPAPMPNTYFRHQTDSRTVFISLIRFMFSDFLNSWRNETVFQIVSMGNLQAFDRKTLRRFSIIDAADPSSVLRLTGYASNRKERRSKPRKGKCPRAKPRKCPATGAL